MIGRNVPIERKLIEQRGLLNSLMPHYDSALSQRLNQPISSAATADFFNMSVMSRLFGKNAQCLLSLRPRICGDDV
jgi:hypothetical protein